MSYVIYLIFEILSAVITLKNRFLCIYTLKTFFRFLVVLILFQKGANAQRIYRNGNLQTGNIANDGTIAPFGYLWSELQNETGNLSETNTMGGYSCLKNFATLSDDFTVPDGQVWNISKLSFFSYQTDAPISTSPFAELFIRIYNGPPNSGGTIIFGDLITNRLSSSVDSKVYRIYNTVGPSIISPNMSRLIWKNTANVSLVLSSGTYWVEWMMKASNFYNLYSPSNTVIGQRSSWESPTANALQYLIVYDTWGDVVDTGYPSTAPDVNVDFPFEVEYITTCQNSVTVNNTTNTNDVKAQQHIITEYNISNRIPTSANVTFQAGNSIFLNPGFKTSTQSVFTAKILGNCL